VKVMRIKTLVLKAFYRFFTSLFTPIYKIERKVYTMCLKEYLHKGRIAVDVGCDGKGLLKELSCTYDLVLGIDIDESSLREAKKFAEKYHLDNVMLIVADAHNLPFKENIFGLITCTHVLEHLTFPEASLSEFIRVLKPRGFASL